MRKRDTNHFMSRKVDPLGRITIPRDIYKLEGAVLGKTRYTIHYEYDSGKIVLEKEAAQCTICGDKDIATSFKGKNICKKCYEELLNMKKINGVSVE